jgi:predicted CoA-binding protein
MPSPEDVAAFLAQRRIAVIGASRSRLKYGNIVYRSLRSRGYEVLAVNPAGDRIEGDPCYPDLASVPGPVGAAIFIVPPAKTEALVREAAAVGIRCVWMQPGAESEAALRFCEERGMRTVHGLCILMGPEARNEDD